MSLYRRCEKEGIGISVMKAFSGGQLLDAKASPFGQVVTEYQCQQYALDKPSVLTVLPGIRGKADLDQILGFLEAKQGEKDYSVIGSVAPQDANGKCVYCNHRCPFRVDQVSKMEMIALYFESHVPLSHISSFGRMD